MLNKRIVITGIGVISPIGIGKDKYWQSLFEGKSGIKPITLFDVSGLKVRTGGEISNFNPKEILGDSNLRTLDRATLLLASSTKLAIDDAKLEINKENNRQIGVSVGTTFGSLNSISEFDKASVTDGPRYVNPSVFPNTVFNSPASQLSIRFHIKGFNTTISSGMCAGLDAIDYARDFLYRGRAKTIICGAVEEFCIQTFLGFYKLNYLAGLKNNSEPVSCPFDKRRNGIVFSEGATTLMLESLDDASFRKTKIYTEILGIGSYFDPYRLTKYNPEGKGMKQAMHLALKDAGLSPQDIGCVFANANSTQDADKFETQAVKDVFGSYADKIPIVAVKSMLGETFSTGGGLAVIAAIGGINNGFIPPTINYKKKDLGLDLDYVPNKARKFNINTAMVNTFGQNGWNKSLIIGRRKK
ncbi:MAG: beta-ketoacyl-[acyl-carrier-protein] synthase family protein [Candidatus Omnitrophica bacterium]|nr:beta-ketoacyl-[acyl-carrier-protein] synthase family protein [Candidatus Omnitrophota bacterium]